MPRWGLYAIGLFGAVFFLVGCGLMLSFALRGRRQAEAEILEAAMESFQSTDEGQTVTLYRTKYELRYMAEGRSFQMPLRNATGYSRPDIVQAKLRENPVGSRRPIYYVPGNPQDVTGEPVARRMGFAMIFVSCGITVFAITAALFYQTQPINW